MGRGGLSISSGLTAPGFVTIDTSETAYAIAGSTTIGQDILCGLNVRFGADLSQGNCGQFLTLSPLFGADTNDGVGTFAGGVGLQDFATEYDGNLRRILTMPVVDAADSL